MAQGIRPGSFIAIGVILVRGCLPLGIRLGQYPAKGIVVPAGLMAQGIRFFLILPQPSYS